MLDSLRQGEYMALRRLLVATAALVVMTATSAFSVQTPTPAFRAGLKVAKSRHYERPECYARVFAQHAHLINHRKARNFWAIEDGPRFSAAVWNECRISR